MFGSLLEVRRSRVSSSRIGVGYSSVSGFPLCTCEMTFGSPSAGLMFYLI